MGFLSLASVSQAPPLALVPNCGECGLLKRCQTPKMAISGLGKAGILIVAAQPSETADRGRRARLDADTRAVLATALSSAGVSLADDCWFTYAQACHGTAKDAVKHCRPLLLSRIKELNPKVVILLGLEAVSSVIGYLWKPNIGKEIDRWVGWTIPARPWNCWVCPTYDPADVKERSDYNAAWKLLFARHVKEAVAKAKSRPWENEPPDYAKCCRVILDEKVAVKEIDDITRHAVDGNFPVAWDLETNCLKPDNPEAAIACCSMAVGTVDGPMSVAYIWTKATTEATKRFLKSPAPKIGANCFSGNTKFLTKEYGVVLLKNAVGESLTVLNHEGRWVPAKVQSFGIQKTVETVFSRRNFQTSVWATEGHEWLSANDRGRLKTVELRKQRYAHQKELGPDQVPFGKARRPSGTKEDYIAGVRHGIIYGDGSRGKSPKKTKKMIFRIRLCGHKNELIRYFRNDPKWCCPSQEGDQTVHLRHEQEDLKSLPRENMSLVYFLGFYRGLMATDGCVAANGQIHLTNKKEAVDWCRQHLPKIGVWFQGETKCQKYRGKYESEWEGVQDTRSSYLTRESVVKGDFLLSKHKRNFRPINRGPYKFSRRGEPRVEEVFCAVVPDGNSFTLDNGLVTGNCKFEDRWARRVIGCRVKNWWHDVVLAGHLLNNVKAVTSVKFQAFVHLGMPDYDSAVKPFLESREGGGYALNRVFQCDWPTLLQYCAMDSLLEYEIATVQRKLMFPQEKTNEH